MKQKEAFVGPHNEKNTIQNYPGVQRSVADILSLSHDVEMTDADIWKMEKKLTALISSIRKCLRTPEGLHSIADVFNSAMEEIQSREKVRKIYGAFPLDLEVFTGLELVSQMAYLFAEKRDADLPGAICHHWTVLWYNFWNECKKGTLFQHVPIMLCQRTNNKPDMGYGQHTFLLLELEKRYVLSTDGKTGVTMKEAINFSQIEKDVFRTVKQSDGFALERIRTFKNPKKFAKALDAIPTRDVEIERIISGDRRDQSV
ncbi:hypothetical protein KA071_01765 [Candidatus Gracilibacteria bacterium]|nr:hypothetical protein [Candidatus Gracilibacteria bacterium]